MFSFNPEMAIGDSMDDGEEAFDSYLRDEEDDNENMKVSSFVYYGQKNFKNHYILNCRS